MGRKSPSYHGDSDKGTGSYRPGSVTSSELSDVSSLSKKSNAPKIVAVVIVSLAIVAILVGVTVYLIDAEKAKQKIERQERLEEGLETEMDFDEENAKAFIAAEESDTEPSNKALDLRGKSDIYENLSRKLTKEQVEQLKEISQRKRFLENWQKSKQEEFLRPTEEEKEIISSLIANRKPHVATGPGHHNQPRTKPHGQDLEFGGVGLFGPRHHQAFPAVPPQERPGKANHRQQAINEDMEVEKETLLSPTNFRDDADPAHGDIYDMSSYLSQQEGLKPPPRRSGGPGRRNFRNRNKFLRPGLEGFRRNEPVEINVYDVESEEDLDSGDDEMSEPSDIQERLGSPASGMGSRGESKGPGLATIDRRPGRPVFHHQGPIGLRPFGRRRFRPGSGQAQARQGAPSGGAMSQGHRGHNKDQVATETQQMMMIQKRKMLAEMSSKKQEEILSNFDSFLKIAGSEMGLLRNVAKNITSSGKEVNLWEVLSAVNETVRKNPDSSIAQLMAKFEDKYLADGGSGGPAHPAQAVYERSLSSLLFLSMGIFLLNSVNELVDGGNLPNTNGQSRSFPTNRALEAIAKDDTRHEELLELFNSTAFDVFDHNTEASNMLEMIKPGNPATMVDSYAKLVMNLMNAYMKDSAEFECIYAAYCYEVNQQAGLGGMASSVAKINSVGLRLAMHELESSDTIPALVKSLWSWEDLPCDLLFPQCDLGFTKVEKN